MAGSINSLIFIWSEYAQLYENDQKETKNNIVETTFFKIFYLVPLGSLAPQSENLI